MNIAYFDIFAGVSGDMTLGAFVDAGLPLEDLSREVAKLNLEGVELQAEHKVRNGITATKVEVVISAKESHHHRHPKDVYRIIESSTLSDRVKARAKGIFGEVIRAEGHIHNTTPEKLHLHEVGMLDSIVDICGAAICFELMNIEAVYSSPVKLGNGGMIHAEHGLLPNPGPAALEILKGYPVILSDIPWELTTPTGAAIIKYCSSGVLSTERIRVESIGYGAGTREMKEIPNLLRVMIGTLESGSAEDDVVVVETNIDDMNPEIYPYVIERLMSAGAHDAYLVPVIMKKGRPGMVLSVLTERRRLNELLPIIFSETSTIGVRIQPVERRKLERTIVQVDSSFGIVKAKQIRWDDAVRLVPEFEECKRIAVEKSMPLRDVYTRLEKEFGSEKAKLS